MARLGIIAGAGALPGQIISACRDNGRDHYVLAFTGSADPDLLGNAPRKWIRMGNLSAALEEARKAGIEELVMVGKIPRPGILELIRDPRSAMFLTKVGTRILGDDNLLSAVVRELEETEGFRVISPESLLKDLMAPAGHYGHVEPNANEMKDIRRGLVVVHELGRLDIGQAAIVQNGLVLGVEGAEGTDRLIERCVEYIDPGVSGGVLVKAAKPMQDRRIDLPAIGVSTVAAVVKAGLRGIAVEEDRALLVEKDEMIKAADLAKIFLFGVPFEC